MIIHEVPKAFQPKYKSDYPKYSSGKNMEEIFFEFLIFSCDSFVSILNFASSIKFELVGRFEKYFSVKVTTPKLSDSDIILFSNS